MSSGKLENRQPDWINGVKELKECDLLRLNLVQCLQGEHVLMIDDRLLEDFHYIKAK